MQTPSKAFVVCRISRISQAPPVSSVDNTEFRPSCILSLDSQEGVAAAFLAKHNLVLDRVLKLIGSAYNKPQNELFSMLNSAKKRVIVFANASRLSRSEANFEKIWAVCKKQGHVVALADTDTYYYPDNHVCHSLLLTLVQAAEAESRQIGINIRRSIAHKRKFETVYGTRHTPDGTDVIPDPKELSVVSLIYRLSEAGSDIKSIASTIRDLSPLNAVEFEPFEVIETDSKPVYDKRTERYLKSPEKVITDKLPYGYEPSAIVDTLRAYRIRRRGRLWTLHDIEELLHREREPQALVTSAPAPAKRARREEAEPELEMLRVTDDPTPGDEWVCVAKYVLRKKPVV